MANRGIQHTNIVEVPRVPNVKPLERKSNETGYLTGESKEEYDTREEGMRVLRSVVNQEAEIKKMI